MTSRNALLPAPRHEHECDICVYLGQWNEYDLYYHPVGMKTIVARYGDRDDYLSGLAYGERDLKLGRDTPMAHAFRLAAEVEGIDV